MARLFNGSSDKIVASSYTPVRFTNSTPFTLSSWFYITVSQTGIIMNFQQNVAGQFFVQFNVTKPGGILKLQGAVGRQNVGANTITGGTTLSLNTWYHGILTYDTSVENLYLNAVSDASPVTYTQGTSTAATGNINIGQGYNGATFFGGRIAECAAWNVVLTANERASLALGVPPSRIRTNGLIMYYPIWGTASPEANLATVTGKTNGTVTGTTLVANPPMSRYSPGARGQYRGSRPPSAGQSPGWNALLVEKYFAQKFTPREDALEIKEQIGTSTIDLTFKANRKQEVIRTLEIDFTRNGYRSIPLYDSIPTSATRTKSKSYDVKISTSRLIHETFGIHSKQLDMNLVPKRKGKKSRSELLDDLNVVESIDWTEP